MSDDGMPHNDPDDREYHAQDPGLEPIVQPFADLLPLAELPPAELAAQPELPPLKDLPLPAARPAQAASAPPGQPGQPGQRADARQQQDPPARRAGGDPRTCPTAVLQRRIRHTPPNDLGACARGFLALPAAASLTVLVSAACLLGGVWGILAPTLGDAALIDGRFAASGSIAAYLAALFACTWLLLRWQRGNHDAIGPALVAAAFLPGLGITIDLVAADRPAGAGLLAAGGLVLGLLLWHGWRQATDPGAPGAVRDRLPAVLLLLLAWNMIWPVLQGTLRAAEAAQLAAVHAWNGPHAFSLWLPGWASGLAAGALLLHAAAHGPSPWRDEGQPFILRAGMRWVLALTLFATSSLHQWSLAHVSGIDLSCADGLAPFALLALTVNELCARAVPRDDHRERWLMVALGIAGLWLGISAAGQPPPEDDTIPAWVRLLMAEVLAPAPVLAMVALAAVGLGRHRGSSALAWGAAWPLLAAALVWHADPGVAGLNWAAGTACGALLLGGWACWHRRLSAGLLALAIVQGALAGMPRVREALADAELMPPLVLMAAYATTLLLVALAAPRLLPARLLRYAAWGSLLGIGHCLADHGAGFHAPVLGGLAAAGMLAAVSWRTRDWLVALPLAAPACWLAVRWAPENKAWLAVWAAFALLGATLALGWQRIKAGAGARQP
jgi:hypothetical protein